MQQADIRERFWERFSLDSLTSPEWEALCDGCGVCCLVKFLDEDDSKFTEYTDVACKLLDCATGHCSDYPNRNKHVPDCIRLTPQILPNMMWLPAHCAYKRLYQGKGLPTWHRLVAGSVVHDKMLEKIGARGRCVSESNFSDDEIEERIVSWVRV